ncbi:MAG: hypothetical protein U0103_29985 [Candidatus Obscuribacterales bacterium]
MAFFVQLGQSIRGVDGIVEKRIKKTGNRFGGESGKKGGYGSGTAQERRARRKRLEQLQLVEQIDELQEQRREAC